MEGHHVAPGKNLRIPAIYMLGLLGNGCLHECPPSPSCHVCSPAAAFCKRSDQKGVSFPEEEGTTLGAPRGISLLS